MSINTAPIYDYNAWIQQVPDYDWNGLIPEPVDIPGDYEPAYSNDY